MEETKVTLSKESLNKIFSVNSSAEKVLNAIAIFMLVLGAIAGLVVLISSFANVGYSIGYLFAGLFGGPVVFFLAGVLPWASIKVIVNISRNLHAIREKMDALQK